MSNLKIVRSGTLHAYDKRMSGMFFDFFKRGKLVS